MCTQCSMAELMMALSHSLGADDDTEKENVGQRENEIGPVWQSWQCSVALCRVPHTVTLISHTLDASAREGKNQQGAAWDH